MAWDPKLRDRYRATNEECARLFLAGRARWERECYALVDWSERVMGISQHGSLVQRVFGDEPTPARPEHDAPSTA